MSKPWKERKIEGIAGPVAYQVLDNNARFIAWKRTWGVPMSEIARTLGVHYYAVHHWCRKRGLTNLPKTPYPKE
uniref:Putative DNA binding, helix-turn-helix domain containing protein n=1 Tax=viral metagenome TaxID=1070528 RepID=A0A6H1ZGG6_9ZZZZ